MPPIMPGSSSPAPARERIDPAFEFSAPRFCNLSRELEQELRYEDVGHSPDGAWFERTHPLHEPAERAHLVAALSPSVFSTTRTKSAGAEDAGTLERKSDAHCARSQRRRGTARGASEASPPPSRTNLSGSARRVRSLKFTVSDEKGAAEIDTTRRTLRFDESESVEAAATQHPTGCSTLDEPVRSQRQAQEVELLLRKHNRLLHERKKELRQQKIHERKSFGTRQSSRVSPQKKRGTIVETKAQPGKSRAPDVSSGDLKKMLEEHNRRIREARQSRSKQSSQSSRLEHKHENHSKQRPNDGVSTGQHRSVAGGTVRPSANKRKAKELSPPRGPRLRETSHAKHSARSVGGFDEKENMPESGKGSLEKAAAKRTAKVEFTSSVASQKPNSRRRKTDAHSELTKLLREHNSRVRLQKAGV
eukprot:CAMPEP_0198737758 /NCGR_PEP_ID=MMETSP1475-20131203/68028_1 /TAXON_ID= ORGANISM="Unidentified sp., Strain CCMP1999" /NCGR_SAMPLE_ID=MMETSP1475 /ASSEMBLY_ACC=CAM_ASM_001111 /LENGTH=418 /DNA_ID=CAMNT_0044501627 /DNA_START=114 /DNA_END=1371 /DNA_ORIENTATION=+